MQMLVLYIYSTQNELNFTLTLKKKVAITQQIKCYYEIIFNLCIDESWRIIMWDTDWIYFVHPGNLDREQGVNSGSCTGVYCRHVIYMASVQV